MIQVHKLNVQNMYISKIMIHVHKWNVCYMYIVKCMIHVHKWNVCMYISKHNGQTCEKCRVLNLGYYLPTLELWKLFSCHNYPNNSFFLKKNDILLYNYHYKITIKWHDSCCRITFMTHEDCCVITVKSYDYYCKVTIRSHD